MVQNSSKTQSLLVFRHNVWDPCKNTEELQKEEKSNILIFIADLIRFAFKKDDETYRRYDHVRNKQRNDDW